MSWELALSVCREEWRRAGLQVWKRVNLFLPHPESRMLMGMGPGLATVGPGRLAAAVAQGTAGSLPTPFLAEPSLSRPGNV